MPSSQVAHRLSVRHMWLFKKEVEGDREFS